VFDVSGAGDTVIATLTAALASGATAVEASRLANLAAGVVVSRIGTSTVIPKELIGRGA
jgi:D-beta-D-heptose 7-phosphate kinase/D-beta-D-heptose 1-phosphate adenosyltransferase